MEGRKDTDRLIGRPRGLWPPAGRVWWFQLLSISNDVLKQRPPGMFTLW